MVSQRPYLCFLRLNLGNAWHRDNPRSRLLILVCSEPLDREDSGLPEDTEDVHNQHTQLGRQPLQGQDDNVSQEQLPPGSLR